MPIISVIMLTYNRENFLKNQIDCILGQSFTDFEFIIVDNGSIDDSGKIADKYAEKDTRINVIHRSCGNIGSGRNAGLDAATGKFIAFIDDDDYCESDYLEFLYHLANENQADVSICGAADKAFQDKLLMTPKDAVIALLRRSRYNVAFPAKLIKRKLFENNRFLNTGSYDDIYLMPRILASAVNIAYHGLPKYTFYRHDGNNSSWTTNHKLLNAKILREYLDIYCERTLWLSEKFPDNAADWRYFEWSFMLSMIDKISRLGLADCYDIRDNLIATLLEHKKDFLHNHCVQDFEKDWIGVYIK